LKARLQAFDGLAPRAGVHFRIALAGLRIGDWGTSPLTLRVHHPGEKRLLFTF